MRRKEFFNKVNETHRNELIVLELALHDGRRDTTSIEKREHPTPILKSARRPAAMKSSCAIPQFSKKITNEEAVQRLIQEGGVRREGVVTRRGRGEGGLGERCLGTRKEKR